MKIGVFYCSYKPDLVWLIYSIQLVQKFLAGDYGITVVLEPDCDVRDWGFKNVRYITHTRRQADGYQHAMAVKLSADSFTDADWIFILDSDHLLLGPWSVAAAF